LHVQEAGDLFKQGLYWKGDFYPAIVLMMNGRNNRVPWEIDAWKRMGELHKYVVAHLPKADRAMIDITKSHGLKDTWNADYAPWKGCAD
jgi:hypothetical protein